MSMSHTNKAVADFNDLQHAMHNQLLHVVEESQEKDRKLAVYEEQNALLLQTLEEQQTTVDSLRSQLLTATQHEHQLKD